MSFWVVFQKIIQLFLIMMVGFAANKLHFFGSDLRQKVTALVLNLSLPGVILSTVWKATNLPSAGQFLLYFALVLLFYVISFAIGKLASRIIPFPYSMRGVVQFAILFGNVGFMGFPVTESIFGQEGMLYTTMVNLPFNMLILFVGAWLLLIDKKAMLERGDLRLTEADTHDAAMVSFSKEDLKKLLRSPNVIASLVGFLFALTKWPVPAVVTEAASTIGQITTPATMLIVGSSLAETEFRTLFNNLWLYVIVLLRVIITPLLIFVVFRHLVKDDPLFVGVLTVLAGMPVASMGQMLAIQYRVNEDVMARVISLSVLFCGITIPLIATIVT